MVLDGRFPAESYVRAYRRTNRSVYLQELNLPPAARLELQRFLRWNQGRRIASIITTTTGTTVPPGCGMRWTGSSAGRSGADRRLPAGTTYRFHTQRLTANDPLIFSGLLLALGQGVDRPISSGRRCSCRWRCGSTCAASPSPGADGRPAPLVLSERTLFESTAAPPPPVPPRWLARYLFLGVILGCAAAWLGGVARRESSGRVAFGLVAGGWELLAGSVGWCWRVCGRSPITSWRTATRISSRSIRSPWRWR